MKTYPAIAVANEFLDLSFIEKNLITPLKLQKLVYICHGRHLGFYAYPLIKERVEAWSYGPVIPIIYHQFKHYGNKDIQKKCFDPEEELFALMDSELKLVEPEIDTENEKNL